MKLATISSIEGQYFAKDSEGNTRILHVNDAIYDGEIVFGHSSNNTNHSIQVDLLDGVTARIVADGEQAFDVSMNATAFGDDEMSFSIADMEAFLKAGNETNIVSDLREAEFQNEILDTEIAQDEEVLEEETAAGEEEAEEEELNLNFQFRDGNTVDVISDLRQREFVNRTQDYEDEGERFEKESEGRLDLNFDRPTFANPTPSPTPNTTPSIQLNPPSFGPSPDVPFTPPQPTIPNPTTPTPPSTPESINSRVVLEGIVINEGIGTATLTVVVEDAPLEDLTVTLSNGAVAIIPAGETSAITSPFPIQEDDVYIDSESYEVTIQNTQGGGFNELETSSTATVQINDTIDTTTLTLTGDETVWEGNQATYTLTVNNPPQTDLVIQITTSHIDTQTGDYVPFAQNITIPAGETSISFTVQTNDDYFSDNGERYEVSIVSTSGGNYENLIILNPSVTTTILDDTGPETDEKEVLIKLFAADSNGEVLKDSNGNYLNANEVYEGEDPNYIAYAFEEGQTIFNDSTRLNSQTGTVNISFHNGTATGGNVDFDSTAQVAVSIGVSFNTTTIIDTTIEGNENYTVTIDENSYTGAYESVRINTGPATTTIKDAKLFVKIEAIENEANEGENLTYKLTIVNANGDEVNVPNGKDIKINLTYEGNTSNPAIQGNDYIQNTQVTINGGSSSAIFDVPTIDDYYAEGNEGLKITIESIDNGSQAFEEIYPHTQINGAPSDQITTTGIIKDNPSKIDQPTDENNTDEPNNGSYDQDDTVYTIIEGPASVNEGDTTTSYTVKIVDKDGNPVIVTEDTDITITYTNITTQDDDTQYNNGDTITVTIPANGSSNTFTVDTNDDPYNDDGEYYNLEITNVENTGEFENVKIGDKDGDHKDVNTTINEDASSNTEVKIVLVAVDSLTTSINDIVDNDGRLIIDNTNTTPESGKLYYMAIAVDTDGKPLGSQNGTVDISYGATADNTDVDAVAGIDYDNTTVVNVSIGQVFEVQTLDDFYSEGDENFTVKITNPSGTTYESPSIDTNNDTVISTIQDNPASDTQNPGTPTEPTDPNNPSNGNSYGDEDTVYVKITNNDSAIEGNDLTHTVTLVDKDGNPITVPNGETITVTITYNPDETVHADFTQEKTTTVTITGGNSSAIITHTTVDDFISEGNENYTATITDVSQTNGTYENVAIDSNNNSVTGEIIDGVTLGNPTDASVDEDNFDMESNTTTITDTQSLNIIAPNGDNGYELLFDGVPTFTSDDANFNTANGDNLTSDGTNILYDTSTNGIIIGYLEGGNSTDDKVFEITLNKNGVGGADDSYTYTQYKNIDHPISGNGDASDDDDIVLTFGYKITDQGQTSSVEHFTVTVSDSLPRAGGDSITLDEDTTQVIYISDESFAGGTITLNNGDGDSVVANGNSINIYDNTTDKNVVGVLTNNGNGTLTFTPNEHFSGTTAGFSYGVSDGDGDTATGNIGIIVNPIADKPDMNGATEGTESSTIKTPQVLEDNNNNANEEGATDYTATIGLILPQITDNHDYTGDGVNDDQPEKLGLITLSSSTGSTIIANGVEYDLSSDSIKIYITDDPANYHYAGIDTTGAISLTQAQFEAIEVKFEKDNADNPKFTVSVDEYEVNDDNTLDNTVTPASNSQDYEVDILAVTDPVTLAWNADPSNLGSFDANTFTFDAVDEGYGTIDLKSLLTKTSGLETDPDPDLDGSEQRSYTISGIPEGTVITLGDRTVVAGSDGTATINFPDNTADDPDFTMTIAEQFSGTIEGIITLNVTDTDNDSTGSIDTESASVNFTMNVNPVADIVTLKVAQAQGFEDAGRTNSNDENVNADVIDAPENGIELYINVISDDNKDIPGAVTVDAKEEYNVTIDDIPNGGSMYVWNNDSSEWVLVDNSTNLSSYDDLSLVDNGNGTWKITINDYQNDHLCKFIPPYNSDDNYTFNISAVSFDNPDTSVAQTLQIDVAVDAVADIPVNDNLATDTVTDDESDTNSFTLVTTEDSAPINLKNVFLTPDQLDSNDLSTADGSETLTFKVTGLADGFNINGATLIAGTGEGRIWYVNTSDLLNDNITLTTPANFSGQENFQIQFVTTEQAGDSKTHPVKDISIMITPDAEGIINSSDTQDEDVAKVLNFGFSSSDNHSDPANGGLESLESFSIDVTGLEAAGITLISNGIDLTTGKSGYQTITVTNGILETVTATLAEDIDTDYSFNISYTYKDVAVDDNGNTYTDTKTVTDQLYSVTVNAITDDINLAMSTSATDANITDNGGHVTVSANGSFTKTLVVTGIDSDGRGNADTDGSEEFTRVTVSGVPEGITIQGGVYAGDTGGGNYSGFWYVDIPNQPLDADGATYDLVFDVDGSFNASDLGDYNITITAYNQEQNNDVEQSDSQSFTLTIDTEIAGPGPGIPATITAFYQDIDQDNNGSYGDHGYAISTTVNTTITDGDAYEGSVVREDTQFKLSDVIHVETDDVNSAFSITIKNVPADVTIEGMTLNPNGFYTLSGSGNQQAIIDKLQSILITPKLNENTDASDISNTDLAFDIELTTYASGGASNFALINFSASVLPVTDEMDLTIINDGVTDEDVAQTFSITLDNDADGANTLIIDDRVYLKLTENYSDPQGTDGASGTLYYNGNAITTTAVSGVSGISDGNYYIIDHVNYNDTLDFSFLPAQNRDGNVQVDVYVKSQENETWSTYNTDIITSHQSFSFDVTPVTDGFTLGAGSTITGAEDTLVPVVITLENLDSSELLSSVSIGGLPNGFLLFYGEAADGSDKSIANNLGNDGTVSMQMIYGTDADVNTNQWHIPLNGGSLPSYIWIKAPENWSGTIPDLSVIAVDTDGNISPETITAGTITPGVDGLTINPTLSFGNAFEGVGLNLNANMVDLDNSETMTLEITANTGSDALTGDAIFKLGNGTVLSATYNAGTYTIADIPYDQINNIEMVYGSYDGTISVSAHTKEFDGATSSSTTSTFDFISSLIPGMSVSGATVSLSGNIGDYEIDFNSNGITGPVTITVSGNEYILVGINTLKFGADEYTLADIFNDTDSNNDLFSGVIVDGIIEGLTYETTSGLRGFTDFEGAFEYREGDSVTFSIGGVVLGTATPEDLAQGIVFLQDLADVGRTDLNDEYVQKMAVFLQSLDSLGTTADGIQIDSLAHSALSGVSLDLSVASMEDVVVALQEAGYEPLDTDVAMEHVRDMLVTHSDLNEEDFDPVEFAGKEVATEAEELLTEDAKEAEVKAQKFVDSPENNSEESQEEIIPESLLSEDGFDYETIGELDEVQASDESESDDITIQDVIDISEDNTMTIDQIVDLPDETKDSQTQTSNSSELAPQENIHINSGDNTVIVNVDDEILTDGL